MVSFRAAAIATVLSLCSSVHALPQQDPLDHIFIHFFRKWDCKPDEIGEPTTMKYDKCFNVPADTKSWSYEMKEWKDYGCSVQLFHYKNKDCQGDVIHEDHDLQEDWLLDKCYGPTYWKPEIPGSLKLYCNRGVYKPPPTKGYYYGING